MRSAETALSLSLVAGKGYADGRLPSAVSGQAAREFSSPGSQQIWEQGPHPLLPTPSPAFSTVLGTSYVLGDKLSEGLCMGTREPVPLMS